MRWMRRLGYWLRFSARQDELREELAFHRELRANELERQGLSRNAAVAAAHRAMGNETYMREEARGVWLSASVDALLKDWKHAWRGLRRSPVFTCAVVLTVALGIGANTAVFSVVHHLILAPLPYADGNDIVILQSATAGDPNLTFGVPGDLVRRIRAGSQTLEEVSAARRRLYALGGRERDSLSGASITPSFFPMLRVQAARGRGFVTEDLSPDAPPVMMIGDELWQGRFGGARDVIGKTVEVSGVRRTIVGVVPSGTSIPMAGGLIPDLWFPLSLDSVGTDEDVFARLRSGTTSAMATRELQSIMTTLPGSAEWQNVRAWARSALDLLDVQKRQAIEILFIAVGALLLIASANVANLLLARSWARQREFAVRRALGAGRMRLVRYLLTESIMLAGIGGALGLLIAWQTLRMITALRPEKLSDLDGVSMNTTVLLWATGISVITGLLFGLGPAMLSGTQSLSDVLRSGGRTTSGSRSARRLRGGLLVGEIALSLVFVVAAGLLVRSFFALERAPIGYDPRGLVSAAVQLAHEPAPADREAILRTLIASVGAVPGVDRVASGVLPQTLVDVRTGPFAVESPTGPETLNIMFLGTEFVSPDYFRVTRIPLVEGRTFDTTNPERAASELVVNQTLARKLWPNGRALGARLRIGKGVRARWLTVVGIASDLHLPGITGDIFDLQMYRATSPAPRFMNTLVLRTTVNPRILEPSLRHAIERAGLSATLASLRPAESMINDRVLSGPRFALILFGLFALLALVLSAVGLYGVIAYTVAQRTREIGIRIALGADSGVIARLILGDSARLILVGGCVGLLSAFAATRLLAKILYQISPTDPAVFTFAAALLVAVTLAASLIPMRRALRIDPMAALRIEG